jgi:predicted RNA polymerase sigma factor
VLVDAVLAVVYLIFNEGYGGRDARIHDGELVRLTDSSVVQLNRAGALDAETRCAAPTWRPA